jgi:hypothetical protein
MAEQDVMKQLLLVLTRLEARLEKLESTNKDGPLGHADLSKAESSPIFASDENDQTDKSSQSLDAENHERSEEQILKANEAYIEFVPPNLREALTEEPLNDWSGDKTMQTSWTNQLGHLWRLPSDGRVHLSFQKHIIGFVLRQTMDEILQSLQSWFTAMDNVGVQVFDYDRNGKALRYDWETRNTGQPDLEDFSKRNFDFRDTCQYGSSGGSLASWRRIMYAPFHF